MVHGPGYHSGGFGGATGCFTPNILSVIGAFGVRRFIIGVSYSCWTVHLKSENIRTQPLGIFISSCFLLSPKDEAKTARSICTTIFRVSGGFSSLVNTLTPPKGMVALNGLHGGFIGKPGWLSFLHLLGLGE
jgi:hypothetical protein